MGRGNNKTSSPNYSIHAQKEMKSVLPFKKKTFTGILRAIVIDEGHIMLYMDTKKGKEGISMSKKNLNEFMDKIGSRLTITAPSIELKENLYLNPQPKNHVKQSNPYRLRRQRPRHTPPQRRQSSNQLLPLHYNQIQN